MTRYIGKIEIHEYKEGITTINKGGHSYYSDIDVVPIIGSHRVVLWQGDKKISAPLPRKIAIEKAVALLS